ncbi:MAG: sigma-70 family RNA polymerase sigma factor [Betaproteobacteria bacterium]|nr:MAG: sigma-70 family RNA polymerase sigma factor [Betaproteobacteria bacterium]TAG46379.1 MAG: sigma-70 family RNA polymerase sigma factor [Betaproteobacteria bacterium]
MRHRDDPTPDLSRAFDSTNAAPRLPDNVYNEMRRVAQALFAGEGAGHTLSRTAVVHEAWLRMANAETSAMSRQDFVRLSARVMRNLLVDHARGRNAVKRGGDVVIASLDDTVRDFSSQCATGLFDSSSDETVGRRVRQELDLEALDDAMTALAALSARQAQVVEMKFFGNLSLEEIAENLSVSSATVKRDWTAARLFLLRELAHARQREIGES